MTHHSLRECETKFRSAHDALLRLETEIHAFERGSPHKMRPFYRPPESSQLYGQVIEVNEPEAALAWAVAIGHILHDWRCILDYLVSLLSQVNLGRALTPEETELTSFPIISGHPSRWSAYLARGDRGQPGHGLRFTSPTHRDSIFELQPCHPVQALRNQPLESLRELNDRDKHRALLLVAPRLRAVHIAAHDQRGLVETFRVGGSTDGGTEIVAPLQPAYPPLRKDGLQMTSESEVVFGAGAGPVEKVSVVKVLRSIAAMIEHNVLPAFRAELGALQ